MRSALPTEAWHRNLLNEQDVNSITQLHTVIRCPKPLTAMPNLKKSLKSGTGSQATTLHHSEHKVSPILFASTVDSLCLASAMHLYVSSLLRACRFTTG